MSYFYPIKPGCLKLTNYDKTIHRIGAMVPVGHLRQPQMDVYQVDAPFSPPSFSFLHGVANAVIRYTWAGTPSSLWLTMLARMALYSQATVIFLIAMEAL